MIPFVYILYTLYGQLQAAAATQTPAVSAAIKNATMVLLITWLVYPIAYLFPVFDDTSGRSRPCVRSATPSLTSPPRACTA